MDSERCESPPDWDGRPDALSERQSAAAGLSEATLAGGERDRFCSGERRGGVGLLRGEGLLAAAEAVPDEDAAELVEALAALAVFEG